MSAGKVKVFLCGEGPNELGSRFGHPSFQSDERPGVLHTLLARVQPTGWEVGGAREWKSIRKFRVGRAVHEDTRNVQAAALDAYEAGCEVLAFMRDRDRDLDRQQAIEEGIALVKAPAVIGGVAIPTLEGWILALLGRHHRGAPRDWPLPRHVPSPRRPCAVHRSRRAIPRRVWTRAPRCDAISLQGWLARARAVLPLLVAKRSADT